VEYENEILKYEEAKKKRGNFLEILIELQTDFWQFSS
jgi:hypothetical protein